MIGLEGFSLAGVRSRTSQGPSSVALPNSYEWRALHGSSFGRGSIRQGQENPDSIWTWARVLFHRKSHAAERVNHGMGRFIAHASCEQYAGFWIISITAVSNRARRKETSRAKQFILVYTLVKTDSRVATIMAQSSSRVRPSARSTSATIVVMSNPAWKVGPHAPSRDADHSYRDSCITSTYDASHGNCIMSCEEDRENTSIYLVQNANRPIHVYMFVNSSRYIWPCSLFKRTTINGSMARHGSNINSTVRIFPTMATVICPSIYSRHHAVFPAPGTLDFRDGMLPTLYPHEWFICTVVESVCLLHTAQ